MRSKRNNRKCKNGGDVIVSLEGQWKYPGQNTIVPTPTGEITMKGVPYPVQAFDNNTGEFLTVMQPDEEYQFPSNNILEIPMKRNKRKMQDGGIHSENSYKANAALLHYKEILNKKLMEKNPQGYQDYFSNLGNMRRTNPQGVNDYIQNTPFNDYLSPQEVQSTLKDEYPLYLNALSSTLRESNPNLRGSMEQVDDVSKMNYGRRFASLPVNPSLNVSLEGRQYKRDYTFNPSTKKVDFVEAGDYSLRPKQFSTSSTVLDKGGEYQAGGTIYDPTFFVDKNKKYTPRVDKLSSPYSQYAYARYFNDIKNGNQSITNQAENMIESPDFYKQFNDPLDSILLNAYKDVMGIDRPLRPDQMKAVLTLPPDTKKPIRKKRGGKSNC